MTGHDDLYRWVVRLTDDTVINEITDDGRNRAWAEVENLGIRNIAWVPAVSGLAVIAVAVREGEQPVLFRRREIPLGPGAGHRTMHVLGTRRLHIDGHLGKNVEIYSLLYIMEDGSVLLSSDTEWRGFDGI